MLAAHHEVESGGCRSAIKSEPVGTYCRDKPTCSVRRDRPNVLNARKRIRRATSTKSVAPTADRMPACRDETNNRATPSYCALYAASNKSMVAIGSGLMLLDAIVPLAWIL
jgi:hypothetical protein